MTCSLAMLMGMDLIKTKHSLQCYISSEGKMPFFFVFILSLCPSNFLTTKTKPITFIYPVFFHSHQLPTSIIVLLGISTGLSFWYCRGGVGSPSEGNSQQYQINGAQDWHIWGALMQCIRPRASQHARYILYHWNHIPDHSTPVFSVLSFILSAQHFYFLKGHIAVKSSNTYIFPPDSFPFA